MTDSLNSSTSSYNHEHSLTTASRNNLLSSFYGLSEPSKPEPAQASHISAGSHSVTSTVTSTVSELFGRSNKGKQSSNINLDKHNIDAADFKPEQYITYLTGQYDMKQLIEIDTKLIQSTLKLEKELQNLVYENYTQFIDFTDKISAMNTNVSTMEQYSNTLKQTMQQIQDTETSMNISMQQSRAEYNDVMSINQLLKKLNFLYLLPKKLKSLIEQKQYSSALQYYNKSVIVFRQYSKYQSLHSIKQDADSMMQDLYAKLKILVRDPTLSELQELEYVSILCQLNKSVQSDANDIDTIIYDMLLKKQQHFVTDMHACSSDSIIEELQIHFIQPFVLFYSRYLEFFTIRSSTTRRQSITAVETHIEPLYSTELTRFSKDVFDTYFTLIAQALHTRISALTAETAADAEQIQSDINSIIASIDTVYDNIQTAISMNQSILQYFSAFAELAVSALLQQVYAVVNAQVKQLLHAQQAITTISKLQVMDLTQSLTAHINTFVYTVYTRIHAVVEQHTLNIQYTYDKSIFYTLCETLQHGLPNKRHKITTYISNTPVTQCTNPLYFLLISQLIQQYCQTELVQQLEQFSKLYTTLNKKHIATQLLDVQQILLENYIVLHSNALTDTLTQVLHSTLNDAPNTVSQHMVQYVTKLHSVETDEINHFYEPAPEQPTTAQNQRTSSMSLLAAHDKNLKKLFQQKIYTFTNEKITSSTQLYNYIQRVVCKNVLELVRLHDHITANVVMQYQIDLHYYKKQVKYNSEVSYFVDEIVHCLSERCAESVTLVSEAQLDSIVKK